MPDQKLVNIRIDSDLWARLKHRSIDEDRTVTAILVELIEGYLGRKPRRKAAAK